MSNTGLPTYHQMLDHLCDELGIPGSPTFWEAVQFIKDKLPPRPTTQAPLKVTIVSADRPD